ncbi:hypothetical protein A1O3_06401 [Capronia epimyces CBS 606.96]|uniref:Alcohol dehydrogenase-like N-terminal domain-containing protein n=1 Tax=Capronia epimyces CBS 606.96 TaxID=1182542 RepID=W9XQU0_9EURO|nr:uncharacterized protein A1O3_06401 [Capronia epimyces CBS 606.96]EXJ82588.1 hypothetical protein A1O3_06401 [Capronia epimyces CBS 606.96]
MASLPDSHRALTLSSVETGPEVKRLGPPSLLPGSTVVQILSSPVLSYAAKVYTGALQYPLCLPMTIGGSAIARVVAVGSDATRLSPGQLVLVDSMIRGRDDPTQAILLGVHGGLSEGAARLMQGDWRDGSCAELARLPLENVHVLDEETLTKTQGHSVHHLAYLLRLLVPMGGLVELDVQTGDRVVIAPATGQFGGAAVEAALALGADVVICGRRRHALDHMKHSLAPVYPQARIDVVVLSGTVDTDVATLHALGPMDKFLDFSPAAAAGSTHITSILMALRKGGRACLMGGITGSVAIPYQVVMFNDLHIGGKFMYERDAVHKVISLVQGGRLRIDLPHPKVFALHEWESAFKSAEESPGWRQMVVFDPSRE